MRKLYRAMKKIERSKAQKEKKRIENQKDYTYDKTYTYQHFIEKIPDCMKNVGWKASVQNYRINGITKTYNDYLSMKERNLPRSVSDKNMDISERGKSRNITPIHVKDRMIQKVMCDYALVPIIRTKLIYDNGASLSGKGVSFSRNRMTYHLIKAIKEYGTDFYVLSFDFKGFFDSIPLKTCRMMLERYIEDKNIIDVTMEMIKQPHLVKILKIKDKQLQSEELKKLNNDEYCGICLGSQVSQIMALIVANDLDHYIKDFCRRKYYVRYMDDGIILGKTKEELQELLKGMNEVCDFLGLHFNHKKTHITKIHKGFKFLQVRYWVTDSGKIVKKLARPGITRMRRKLHKFKKKVDNGTMTLDNVYDSTQSWLAHSKVANSHNTVKNMMKLYRELYGGYRMSKGWKKKNRRDKNVLQVDKWAKYRWCCDI